MKFFYKRSSSLRFSWLQLLQNGTAFFNLSTILWKVKSNTIILNLKKIVQRCCLCISSYYSVFLWTSIKPRSCFCSENVTVIILLPENIIYILKWLLFDSLEYLKYVLSLIVHVSNVSVNRTSHVSWGLSITTRSKVP